MNNNYKGESYEPSGMFLLAVLVLCVASICGLRAHARANWDKAHVPASQCIQSYEHARIGTVCTEVKTSR